MGLAVAVYRSPLAAPVRPLLRRWKTSPLLPMHWAKVWRACKILTLDYGYLRSVAGETPVDRDGAPCPWYTYPALEYLRQLDFRDKSVFEYGCGHSTRFWAARAARVYSVEHNREWYERIRPSLPGNCQLTLETDPVRYAAAIADHGQAFDVIVIDGLVQGRTRLRCAQAALPYLRPGGMIILDNSDWLPESAHVLRGGGLIQVDMTGFAPVNDYTCTTTFFLHRDFAFAPLQDRQPMPGVGARPYNWEEKAMRERQAAAGR